ncbi:MAG TPA: DUF1549 domain-containing protein [Planctomycetia bacterium]|nr:DUF1549 domain-containing protein [Planctomycetia bacterium]
MSGFRLHAWTVAAAIAILPASFGADKDPPKSPPKAAPKKPPAGRLSALMTKLRTPAKPGKVDEIKPYANSNDRQNLKSVNPRTLGAPLTPERLDSTLAAELEAAEARPGKPISDAQFVRRVYLDLIGQLPAPADISDYLADASPDKKAKLIDRLLALPEFGVNWGKYWHDAISYRNTGGKNREFPFALESWLVERFNAGDGWDKIVAAMLTANGPSDENPQGMFIAAHDGMAAELAGETARLFLGIQISCAQCHDHPTDHWKRDQFHELAAFYGKTALRPVVNNGMRAGFQITTRGGRTGGEYRKPNLQDPSDPGTVVQPAFLTGQPLPPGQADLDRRKALAEFVTSRKNGYFAKAFVNRVWAEMIGEGFTPAVDDLGDQHPPVFPKTFEALGRSFAATNFDVKKLFRLVALSSAYGTNLAGAEGESESNGVQPTRLTAAQIYDSLRWTLGGLGERTARDGFVGPRLRAQSFGGMMETAFGFDPSSDAGSLEGSIPQALLLMNNAQLHARIAGKSTDDLLPKLLKSHPKDEDAIVALYLRVLARRPSQEEISRCHSYLREASGRTEAFEDLLWALLNTAEFLHNH